MGLFEKLLSKENKNNLREVIIKPLLFEISNEIKPLFYFLILMYLTIILPLIFIIITLVRLSYPRSSHGFKDLHNNVAT